MTKAFQIFLFPPFFIREEAQNCIARPIALSVLAQAIVTECLMQATQFLQFNTFGCYFIFSAL